MFDRLSGRRELQEGFHRRTDEVAPLAIMDRGVRDTGTAREFDGPELLVNPADRFNGALDGGHASQHTELRMSTQGPIRKPVITELRQRRHDGRMPRKTDKAPVPSPRAKAFKAWMKARKTNTRQVSIKSGVNYQTLASFVQGATQQLLGGREEKVAKAHGVEASEIFGGVAPARDGAKIIPIIDSVAAGRLTDPNSQISGEHQTIEISGLPPGDYFATRVDGTSMDRLSPPGSLILVNRAERDLIRGRRYIFTHRGRTTYKRYEVEPLRLEPETTDPSLNHTIYPKTDDEWLVIGRVRLTLFDDM